MDMFDDVDLDLDEMLGVEAVEEVPAPSGQQHDPRRKRSVCKHWLRGLCKQGDDCDFLHVYDPSRMPQCLCVEPPAPCPRQPPRPAAASWRRPVWPT